MIRKRVAMMGDTRTVEFCGELKRETDQAYLIFDGGHNTWLPKSQIESMRRIGSTGPDYKFIIPVWLAHKTPR